LIFAYGLVDPDPSRPDGDITYHDKRRGARTIPLRSYNDPPSEDKFAGLDTFEWRTNNVSIFSQLFLISIIHIHTNKQYLIPPNDTTYHCKIHKAPSGFTTKRHAIAVSLDSSILSFSLFLGYCLQHKMLIDPSNLDIVHHLLLYECDPTSVFDDTNLPDGACDNLYEKLELCTSNIASGWAVGGDFVSKQNHDVQKMKIYSYLNRY
jgi:hypothetical protein